MQDHWQKFTDLHGGKHFSRDVFVEFCSEILDKHYAAKDIVVNSNFSSYKSRRNAIVYLSKFFDKELNSSRKGQIRNSFKKFITQKEKTKQKVYAWVVCIPYVLNDEELKWWLSWIDKQRINHRINIELFDGDYLIELSNKYDLYKKWFTPIEELKQKDEVVYSKASENDNIFNFELIEDDFNKDNEENEKEEIVTSLELIEDKHDDEKEHIEEHHQDENNKNIEETEEHIDEKQEKIIIEKEIKKEDIADIKDKKEKKKREAKKQVEPAKKIAYDDYLADFERIKAVALNFTEEQKEQLKEINSNGNWIQLFEEIEISDLKTLQLFYKAKSKEVHKKYPSAVFVYEKILQKSDFKVILHHKIQETYTSLKKCKTKTEASLYELEGDVHLVRNNLAKAVVFYEKAFKLDTDNSIIEKKYFETLGDNQVKNDIPEHAVSSYERAKNINNSDKELKNKYKNAKYLNKGDRYLKIAFLRPLNVFTSPFWYMAAYSTIKEKNTKKKLEKSLTKFYFVTSILLIFLIAVLFGYKKSNIPNVIVKSFNDNKSTTTQPLALTGDVLLPLNPAEVAFNEGMSILDSISYSKIHLIDTAISAFTRALTYTPENVVIRNRSIIFGANFNQTTDSLSYNKLNEAKQYKDTYLTKVQTDILQDSAAHFIGMRRFSDGLKLFKYTFQPNDAVNGKYGFVDSLMNVIVPPMYDFDYKNMYSGKESFINGRAFICLITSTNDTTYYYIDKNGTKL